MNDRTSDFPTTPTTDVVEPDFLKSEDARIKRQELGEFLGENWRWVEEYHNYYRVTKDEKLCFVASKKMWVIA